MWTSGRDRAERRVGGWVSEAEDVEIIDRVPVEA